MKVLFREWATCNLLTSTSALGGIVRTCTQMPKLLRAAVTRTETTNYGTSESSHFNDVEKPVDGPRLSNLSRRALDKSGGEVGGIENISIPVMERGNATAGARTYVALMPVEPLSPRPNAFFRSFHLCLLRLPCKR